jgi:hypothetical protein
VKFEEASQQWSDIPHPLRDDQRVWGSVRDGMIEQAEGYEKLGGHHADHIRRLPGLRDGCGGSR